MKAFVTLKSVYGDTKVYPHCSVATGFANIAGTKTLTKQTLVEMKKLGVEIIVHADETISDLLR